MSNNPQGFFSHLNKDLPAAIVVFLVALPLCLGIASVSGAPPLAGIIAGIVGGTVVALMSGSPLGVSGPAAGLAVIVLNAINDFGGLEFFDVFLLTVVLAGVIQVLLGVLKAGVIGYYFPSAVIKGMLAGIGVIIILKEIPHFFGYDSDPEGDFEFFQVDGENTFSELLNTVNNISPGAALVGVVSLVILILWEQGFIKKLSFSKFIQGTLVAVVLGIVLNLLLAGGEYALTGDELVELPVPDSFQGFLNNFTFPDFTAITNPAVWITALTIAVVASLETLLCVEATDKLDPYKRNTPTNRELLAQGTGNIVSGMIGGLPITQVIVRSSANIQSGGMTKASAFFHGILLLLTVAFIPDILNLIPRASLAAILLMVGYKLAKPATFKAMWQAGFSQFLPFIVTVVAIVFTDLLIGIGLGMVVAIIHLLWNNFQTPYHFDADNHVEGQPIRIELSEDVSFLNKASIENTLNNLPDGSHVIIDGRRAKAIHPDIIEIIQNFQEARAPAKNIQVEVDLITIRDMSTAKSPMNTLQQVIKPPTK